jgi:hypothetical protein
MSDTSTVYVPCIIHVVLKEMLILASSSISLVGGGGSILKMSNC